MKKLNIIILLTIFFLLFGCSKEETTDPVSSTGNNETYTISGTVINKITELGVVVGAKLEVLESGQPNPIASQTTGNDGKFSFELKAEGNYTINLYKPGSSAIDDNFPIQSLDRNYEINFRLFVVSAHKIFGQVVNIEKEPLADLELKLKIYNKNTVVIDEQNATTNSSGNFEFIVDYEEYSGWQIEILNDELRFRTNGYWNGLVLLEDTEINFRQIDDIEGSWTAIGQDIADSSNTTITADSIKFTIGEDYIIGTLYSQLIDKYHYFNARDYVINKSASGDIHEIHFPISNSDTLYNDYSGIYRIEKTSPKWTLTLEFVDLNKENTSAPTVSGGFGSSNGGANGDAYVWKFIKTN